MSEPDFLTLDLTEMGTRLDHYNELREVFALGVEMLKTMNPVHLTELDKEKQIKLHNAADAIQGRIDMLAKFPQGSGYGSWLQMTIDMVGRNQAQLTGGSHVNQADGSDAEGEGTEVNS
jgi:hypothetical protein